MSAFNIKSTVLANRDATPKVLSEGILAKGVVKEAYGCQKVSSAGSDLNQAGTQIRLISVPSVSRLSELEYAGTSCGTSVLDVAVWYPTVVPLGAGVTATGGSLISSSKFLSNINIPDTNQAFTTAFPAIATLTVQDQEKPLWQLMGLTSDPNVNFDIGFTVRTACSINGYVALRAKYTE